MEALLLPSVNIEQKSAIMTDLDFDTISRLIYPIGSTYISLDSSLDPNTFLYGKWELSQSNDYYIQGENQLGYDSTESVEACNTNTGATALSVSQIASHLHYYGVTKSIKVSAANGSEWRTWRNDVSAYDHTYRKIVPTGDDGSHTHSLNKHLHTIDIPSISINLWIRKE